MRGRELRLAVLLVLLGAALVLLAGARDWVAAVVPAAPPLPARRLARTGGELAAGLRPLGLLGLAGVAALAGTRARGRLAVGAVLLAAGVGAVAATLAVLGRGAADAVPQAGGFTSWPYAALLGGVLLGLGGLLVLVRGRRWAALSTRYDAPAAREGAGAAPPAASAPPARPEVAAWDALDRGEDPTAVGAADPPAARGDPGPAHGAAHPGER